MHTNFKSDMTENNNLGSTDVYVGKFITPRTVADSIVFLWFLLLTFYLGWQRIFPYLYDDEYGVLGAAAALAGLDWKTPLGMPFYGFVLSLLIAPFYKLNLEPTLLYRIALSINGFLVALSAFMALHILRRLFQGITELSRVLIVVAAFSYPSVIFYAGLALGETTLLFSFMLILYSLVLLFDQQRNILGVILLAIGLGVAPYAHSRGLAFWVAAAPILLCEFWNQWPMRRFLVTFLVIFFSVVAVLASVKYWLIDNFYSALNLGASSIAGFISTKLITAFSPERWVDLALTAYGQFAYLASASFGLVILGLVGIIKVLGSASLKFERRLREQKGEYTESAQVVIASFIGLSFLIMFLLSVVFLAGGPHANHFFYGRYNEILVPTLLISAFVFIDSQAHQSRLAFYSWMFGIICLSSFSALIIFCFPERIFEQPTFWTQITGWFPHIQGAWKIEPKMMAIGIFFGGIIILVSVFLGRTLLILTVIFLFVSSSFYTISGQHFLADQNGAEYANLSRMYRLHLSGHNIYSVRDPKWGFLPAEGLQIALPYSRIHFNNIPDDPATIIFDTASNHCKELIMVVTAVNAKLCVHDPALLESIKAISRRMEVLSDGRSAPPTRIEIKATKIETSGVVSRACAFMAPFFYTGWARYCLPSVVVNVKREGLTGHERQQLGIFISDQSGRWLTEWRVPLDTDALALGEPITVRIPVRFPANLPSGDYRLHIAMFDDVGWDWRSTTSLSLHIK